MPTCGSRSTSTSSPASASSRASLHVERHRERVAGHEQRVEGARRLGLQAQVGRLERVRGHRRHRVRIRAPGAVEAALLGRAPRPRGRRARRRPTRRTGAGRTQPAGSPTARTTSRSKPGCMSSPALRTEEPSNSTSTTTAMNTTISASRERTRGPRGGWGTGGRPSELEVDEGRHALARDRSAHQRHHRGEREAECVGGQLSAARRRSRSSGSGGSSWKPITATTTPTVTGVQSVAGPGSPSCGGRRARGRGSRRGTGSSRRPRG